MKPSSCFVTFLATAVLVVHGRPIDNATDHTNHTIETGEANCLHACLDECLGWKNASFTSEDCLIPCAVYVEESERYMSENGGATDNSVRCNDTRGSEVDGGNAKPPKATLRMSRLSVNNVTEVWWAHVPAASGYLVEVWCRANQTDSLLYAEETWLSWYAFKQCQKCPEGKHARVASVNSHGKSEFSEFSDKLETTNTTSVGDLAGERQSSFNLFGFNLN